MTLGRVSNISAPAVAWDDAATPEEKQQRIITQKWIANFILGNEAWADYRRTGYPVLFPASDAGNLSRGVVDSNKGARRMPYPIDYDYKIKQDIYGSCGNACHLRICIMLQMDRAREHASAFTFSGRDVS